MPSFTHPASGGLTSRRQLREFNDCNLPKGESDGGRFGANADPRCKGGGAPVTDDDRDRGIKRKAEYSRPHEWIRQKFQSDDPKEQERARQIRDQLPSETAPSLQSWTTGSSDRQDIARSEAKARLDQREEDRKQAELAAAMAARRAAGIPEPDLTSQDTKKSDTKKSTYVASDRISSTDGNAEGTTEGIFGSLTHEEAAELMTQYIEEDMNLTVTGGGSSGGSSQEPGPDPSDARSDYERYQENEMDRASSEHYEERTTEFAQLAEQTHKDLADVSERILNDHLAKYAESHDPNAEQLTGEKLAELLDKHGILTEPFDSTTTDGKAFGAVFDAAAEDGDLYRHFRTDQVMDQYLNSDNVRFEAFRDELATYRPSDASLAYKAVNEAPDDQVTGFNDKFLAFHQQAQSATEALMADSTYAPVDIGDYEAGASDWYSDTNQSDHLNYDDYNIQDFDTWYEDRYGHSPDDWEDVYNDYNPDAGGDESEVSFDFSGDSGSTITRVFSRDYDGNVSVYHSYFRNLGPAGQGKGMMRGQMELYEQIGVGTITTSANISTGSYSWARYGFEAESPSSLAYSVDRRFSAVVKEAPELASVQERVNDLISNYSDDPQLPWHVADMRVTGDPAEILAIAERFMGSGRVGSVYGDFSLSGNESARWDQSLRDDAAKGVLNLGKILMTGHSWSARFNMQDEAQRARMRDYIGDWTVPASQQQSQGEAITQRVEAQTQRAAAAVKAPKAAKEPADDWGPPSLRTATTDRANALNAGKLNPRFDYGNTPTERKQTEQTITSSPDGGRVMRMLTNGGSVLGQVTNNGTSRYITPDDPDEVYRYGQREFTGGWVALGPEQPTHRVGQKIAPGAVGELPSGTRVSGQTPRGTLYGRVQGPAGRRGVVLRSPPSVTMPKLMSGVPTWRKK